MARSQRLRHIVITLFVITWVAVFHYETLRLNYLSPLAGRELPKLKFLYPPAGWIMFFHVDASYGFAEVYGIRGDQPTLLDPHAIFATRAVGYDNIRRNALITVLPAGYTPSFCRYLFRKFPWYDRFVVVYAVHPDVALHPDDIQRQVAYRCD